VTDTKDAPGLDDFAPPTELAPTSIKEMAERRRELDAGNNIASLHKYARMVAPGLHTKVMHLIVSAEDKVDVGVLRRGFAFIREKVGGYKQVLTDQELRKAQQIYDHLLSLFHETGGQPDIPPNEALSIVLECYNFVNNLLESYSDKKGVHAIYEIYLLIELAGLAQIQYDNWGQSAGYFMPYKKWKDLGMPNVAGAIPAGAPVVAASKENGRLAVTEEDARPIDKGGKGSEDTGVRPEQLMERLPKIDPPETFRGDYYDIHGGGTRGGSGGKVPT
jgi:hypothetical protein